MNHNEHTSLSDILDLLTGASTPDADESLGRRGLCSGILEIHGYCKIHPASVLPDPKPDLVSNTGRSRNQRRRTRSLEVRLDRSELVPGSTVGHGTGTSGVADEICPLVRVGVMECDGYRPHMPDDMERCCMTRLPDEITGYVPLKQLDIWELLDDLDDLAVTKTLPRRGDGRRQHGS